jgi:hypothetical protein
MTFFFELHIFACLTDTAVLLHTVYVVLPTLTCLILLMETQSAHSVSRLLAEHREYGTFSSWHSAHRIRI